MRIHGSASSGDSALGRRGAASTSQVAPAIRLRYCTEDDIPEVMRFIDQRWRAGHILSRDETLLRWQFDPRRAGTGSFTGLTMVLAVMDGEIGGMLGVIPFDLNIHGTVRRGGWLSQWFCVPELRPYNVGLALLWRIHKLNYDALLGIGVSQAGARVTAALGFQPIPAIPRWVGVFDAAGTQDLLRALAPPAEPRQLRRALLPYLVGRPSAERVPASIRITPWSESLRGPWDRFWTRSLAPSLVGPARDSSYVLWRYVSHPRFRYDIRVASHRASDQIRGLIVFRTETIQGRRQKVMRIVELLAAPEARTALVAALVVEAREQDVVFADFYCTCLDVGATLEAVGFRRHVYDHRTPPLPSRLQPLQASDSALSGVAWLTRDLRQRLGGLAARTDFHVTKSDSDQDRPN